MDEILDFLLQTQYGHYVTIVITVCYILSHIIQYLPVSVTEKIPDWIMTIINLVGAKHGTDKAALTDIKGNSK